MPQQVFSSIDDMCNMMHDSQRKLQTTTLDHPMLSTTAMSTMMMQPTGHKGMSPMQACSTVVGGMVDHSQIMGHH